MSTERNPSPGSRLTTRATLSHKGRGCIHGVMEIGEKSTNQLFGCTKPLIFGLSARGATSWATYKKSASSTEAACSSASAASRAAGSKVWRAFVTNASNLGLLIKPQLLETGGAIDDCRK